jgi:hypothetical protein
VYGGDRPLRLWLERPFKHLARGLRLGCKSHRRRLRAPQQGHPSDFGQRRWQAMGTTAALRRACDVVDGGADISTEPSSVTIGDAAVCSRRTYGCSN